MASNMTTFDAALKQHYVDSILEELVYKDNPFLALVPKYEQFGGKNLPIPILVGNPQGRSATFATAQSRGAATATKWGDFVLTRVKDYSLATIDTEVMEASKGDANAFMEAATVEIDGALNQLSRSLATALYRDGTGTVATVSASQTLGASVLTLATTDDVVNFEVGQMLDVSATAGGAVRAYGSSGNGLIITGIDRSAGTLTFAYPLNDATNGIPTIAASDSISVVGDKNLKLSGFEAWCPATAPTSTLFFQQDRTVDSTRLGGVRYNGVGVPIEEALIEGAARVAREGGRIDHYFMSFKSWSALDKALGSKVQYVDLVKGEVGFRGIQINGSKGPIKVIPDMNCPTNRIVGVQMNTWKLASLGKAVRIIENDGLQMLRQSSADGVEVRCGFKGQLCTNAPGFNVNIAV